MVSERDKAKMRRIGSELAAGETHDRGTDAQRKAILDRINADRARHGLPALTDRAMSELDPSAWLASIAEIFDSLEVEWTLVGALAANRYRATPRFTTDIDTMAEFDSALTSRFEGAGYDVTVIADDGEPPHLIRCYRGAEALDILLPVVDYQRQALARAVDHVLTVEDV